MKKEGYIVAELEEIKEEEGHFETNRKRDQITFMKMTFEGLSNYFHSF